MKFDRKIFFTRYREAFGPLRQSQVTGIQEILSSMEDDIYLTDPRHAAYMLATVKHECADTWLPVEEYGRGKGLRYGNPVDVTTPDGQVLHNVYYGRGYVQLTWAENYLKMDRELGLFGSDSLYLYPSNALKPAVAYRIMSRGMRKGMFTGRSLDDCISGKSCDYFKARRIINGTDRAITIQSYAQQLEVIIKSSLIG